MDFALTDEQELILATVRDFTNRELLPHEEEVERLGYVPAEVAWERWSFVLPNADFSGASVEVSDEHGPVEVQVIDRDRFIETGIVWAMGGESDSDLLPDPSAGDHCYAVKISGVVVNGAVEAPFEYTVCVLGA